MQLHHYLQQRAIQIQLIKTRTDMKLLFTYYLNIIIKLKSIISYFRRIRRHGCDEKT